ncbi:MAG: S-layer homology domain-containing protein [Clostridiales bacterium]|jgi:hypothetical protein|nr:S-layer homology domain-containing protein [Clostridiales bacterium]
MKILKKTAAMAVLVSVFAAGVLNAEAATFKDVASSNYAYAAVTSLSDKGIMTGTGDLFKPNDFLTKFDVSVILAKAAGYKTTGVSSTESAYYAKALEDYGSYINQFAARYSGWDKTATDEIAFLLARGIYKPEDLTLFFKTSDGKDFMRALSKEEAAVFLVRLLGRESEALSLTINPSMHFLDDSGISNACKQYVYYLRSVNVVSGDSAQGASNFNPNNALSRADFAVMLYRTLLLVPANSYDYGSSYTSATGRIEAVYFSFRSVYVSSSDSALNGKIFPVSAEAAIKIDGYVKSFSDLRQGLDFTGVVQNGTITALTAYSSGGYIVTPTQAPSASASAAPTVSAPPNVQEAYSTVEGIVSAVDTKTQSTWTNGSIEVELKLINPRGVVYTEKRMYSVAPGCTITRGDTPVSLSSAAKGDVITVTSSGQAAYSIKLEERNRRIVGTLTEKRVESQTGSVVIVITDAAKKPYETAVTSTSTILRNNAPVNAMTGLRVGDSVDVQLEYDKITELYAYGKRSTIDAWVREISISADSAQITAADANGVLTTYPVITSIADPYKFRVGAKVRLYLDSLEIENFTTTQESVASSATVYFNNYSNGMIYTSDTKNGNTTAMFSCDNATVVVNSITGVKSSVTSLTSGMKIYVLYNAGSANYAKTITILG